jgi:pimeloyl-ACP methyl ester carboxylesterase
MAFPRALLCVLLIALPGVARSQETSSFQFSFDQPFGKYAVGLRVVEQYDRSRSFSADPAGRSDSTGPGRPLQTLLWYPAIPSQTPPMTLGDFEDLIVRETSFSVPTPHGRSQDFVHAFMHGTEQTRTVSLKDARPQSGKFPVIIYAPSINAPSFENIELCEYLASYGFVVIAGPSMGASIRHMEVSPTDAAAQAADILFLLRFAKSLKFTNTKDAAVVGYSWGGTGALLAAAGSRQIRALVAFDGSFRYAPEPSVDPGRYSIPLLFFCRGETPIATTEVTGPEEKANARILNGWVHGDLLQIQMRAISHIQFSSLFQRSERFKAEGPHFLPAGYSLQDGSESYGWIVRYTREFLEAYLKHDRDAHAFLMQSPAENHVPPRLMEIAFRPAS